MNSTTSAFVRSLIFALVLSCMSLAAQTAPDAQDTPTVQDTPTATFSSSVKVVNVFATVRDKKGNIVKDLNKDDFKLLQDSQPQTIRYFVRETDLPLTLGLLVDTSMSQRRMIDQERTASFAFLNEFMRVDKDKAFVMHFDWGTELLQDLTTNTQKLQTALDKLDMPGNNLSATPRPTAGNDDDVQRHRGGSTTLYDAVFLACDEIMRKPEGRKAVILLTDGVDEGSKLSLDRAIEAAQRSNTLVYTIYYSDPEAYGHQHFGHLGGGMGYPGGGFPGGGGGGYPGGPGGAGGGRPQQREEHPDGKKVLQRMSRETGGRFFEITKKDPINTIYDQIGEELRNQYSIGYTPDKAVAGAGYHKILLQTTNKELIVQAREGYYEQQ
jgi:VWFA-related protein